MLLNMPHMLGMWIKAGNINKQSIKYNKYKIVPMGDSLNNKKKLK